jgi:hypothetical protein
MSSVYAPVDDKIISKLSFPYSACNYGYYSNTNGKQLGTLYSTDSVTFGKVRAILRGDVDIQVNKGDKVYILPGHPLAHVRIKEYLKRIGANTTKTLSSATVIAGCEDLYEKVCDYDSQAKSNSLLIEAEEIYEVSNHHDDGLINTFNVIHAASIYEDIYNDYIEGKATVVSNRLHNQIGFDPNIDLVRDRCFITPDAMCVMYYILSKGLKVLTQETIAENANSGLKLEDEETYLSIYQMLDSADRMNQKLGVDILVHCDLTGSTMYNLWRLSRKFRKVIEYADSSKGVNYFKRSSGWNTLRYLNDREFIKYAEEENALTQRMVNDLIQDIYINVKNESPIVEDQSDSWNEDQFFDLIDHGDMSYTVQLKEKWRGILKEKKDEHTAS